MQCVSSVKACVIGAGVVGLTSAQLLAQAGIDVVVLEANSQVGTETSKSNGAQLSYSYVQPLADPGLVKDLPKLLLDKTSPLRFVLKLDPQQWSWGIKFLAACEHDMSRQTTELLLKLAALSREKFDHWLGLNGGDVSFKQNGKLVVYADPHSFDVAKKQVDYQSSLGGAQALLDRDECVTIEPALAEYADNIVGGVYTPSECVADSHKVCLALRDSIESLGGKILCGTTVQTFEHKGGRIVAATTTHGRITADYFILATGPCINRLLRQARERIAVYPLKGYSITVPRASLEKFPALSITVTRQKVVYAPLRDSLRVAGMAEMVGYDKSIDSVRIKQLLEFTAQAFGLQNPPHDLQAWAGLRPASPTSRPIVKRIGFENLYVNAGHGALGFTLAFGTAELLLKLITGSNTFPAWGQAFTQ